MKLLIGIDGSAGSFEAAALASKWVDTQHDQIALYYSPMEVPLGNAQDVNAQLRERARQALGEAVFAEAKKRLPESMRAGVHTIVGTQKPGHGLNVAAESWRADVIVVGARGLGPIKSMFLGSVSRQVVQTAAVPVLVVRPDAIPADPVLRLLLAYHPASAAQQATTVGKFHWPSGTTGSVIRVIESLLAGPLPDWLERQARDADAEAMAQAWVHEHEEELRAERERLTAYLNQLPKAFEGNPPIVLEGHPGEQILKRINEDKIDLVIVGRTAGGALKRMLVGSTSAQILNHAPCSVLVVPVHETP